MCSGIGGGRCGWGGPGGFPEYFHLLPIFCPWCPLSILVAGKIVGEAFLGQTSRWHPSFCPSSGSQGDIRVQVRLRAQKGKELELRENKAVSLSYLVAPIFCLRCISKFWRIGHLHRIYPRKEQFVQCGSLIPCFQKSLPSPLLPSTTCDSRKVLFVCFSQISSQPGLNHLHQRKNSHASRGQGGQAADCRGMDVKRQWIAEAVLEQELHLMFSVSHHTAPCQLLPRRNMVPGL